MQQLAIQGTYNIRDLGGISVSDGRSIKPNVVLRSGNLDKLPPTSQQVLIDYGVKTIIDLRDEWEVEHYPNIFEHSEQVQYHNLPLIGDKLSNDETWKSETKNYTDLAELYINYIEGCKTQIGKIISTLSESQSATIIHCHAGKDRTGIILALVLELIGVSDDDIAGDYALSRENIEHLVQEWRAYTIENNGDLEQLEKDADSLPETILKMLDYIQIEYETVERYLVDCGVSKVQLEQIRTNLVQP